MKYLFILNDAPYGGERTFNGLRLASALAKGEGNEVSIFLMGDAVGSGMAGQMTPNGYYNLERMLKGLAVRGVKIGLCGTCIDARGIKLDTLVEGAKRSSMEELTAWTTEADSVLVF
jgi:uncharacterized protein involved in oxidation of intracellular sulfur